MEERLLSDELNSGPDIAETKNEREASHVPLLKRPLMYTIEEMKEKKADLIALKEAKYANS